jgi:hypothetical protein
MQFLTVQGTGPADLVPGRNCFHFYKTRPLVEQYLDWFATLGDLRGEFIVELGLYEGGSVPFWFEAFQPIKHVGIENRQRPLETTYFDDYVSAESRRGRIEAHWGTSQDDPIRLPALIDRAFGGGPIDVVLDDAAHLYGETKKAFELLFPKLREGGLYIIEDWAWFHWRGIEEMYRGLRPLTELIKELVEVCGSTDRRVIRDIYICSGFAALWRGAADVQELGDSFIDRLTYRHPR